MREDIAPARVDNSSHAYVYWGGARGFSTARRTKLEAPPSIGVAINDLDRDGRLDIVLACLDGEAIIFYGTDADPGRRTVLKTRRYGFPYIADLNRDGNLDVIVPSIDGGVHIFWGEKGNYSAARQTFLPAMGSVTADAADLNGDGWLELLVGNFWRPSQEGRYSGLASSIIGVDPTATPPRAARTCRRIPCTR